MLHNWETKNLEDAKLLFIQAEKKGIGQMNAFPNVLRGRIQYIGTVRGKQDELFQKLALRFQVLYEQEFNKKHFWKLTDNDEFKHYKAKSVSDFFRYIDRSQGLKFLTHDFDKPGEEFSYEKILKIAKEEFDLYFKKYKTSQNIYGLFKDYIFNESPSWSFENNNYGWSTQKLKIWCEENKGLHPIRNHEFRENLINKFSDNISVKQGELTEIIQDALQKVFSNKILDFNFSIDDSLKKAQFSTYVEHFKLALIYLFNQVLKDSQRNKSKAFTEVDISMSRSLNNNYVAYQIEIIHKGAMIRTNAQASYFFSNNLNKTKKFLNGLCEWSIESQFKNGYYRLNILQDEIKQSREEIKKEDISGIKYTLTFYK